MGVGRGEVYLLRKYAEQFLMHFHITHFFLYICICIFAMYCNVYLWSSMILAGVSNVLVVNIFKLIQLTISARNFM